MPLPKKKPADKAKEKVANEGNLAEGVLGAAIVAKLAARQAQGRIAKVNSNDVLKVLKVMQKASMTPKGASKSQVKVDMGGSAKDKITFYLNLGTRMMSELRAVNLQLLDRVAQAASSYVNAPNIEGLAQSMYNNNINNQLEIDVDGISDNKGTKSDVVIRTDKYAFEKISLKAGSKKSGKTLGQIGGNTWSSVLRLFNEGFNPATKAKDFGLKLPLNTVPNEEQYMKLVTETPTHTTVAAAVRWAYKKAEGLFNSASPGANAHNVFKFLQSHSTKGDSDIKILILHLGSHRLLNPLKLEHALSEIKMKAVTRIVTEWPVFIVYDAAMGAPPTTVYSPSSIFAIRPKKISAGNNGYIAHLVEGGPRFDQLLEEE